MVVVVVGAHTRLWVRTVMRAGGRGAVSAHIRTCQRKAAGERPRARVARSGGAGVAHGYGLTRGTEAGGGGARGCKQGAKQRRKMRSSA